MAPMRTHHTQPEASTSTKWNKNPNGRSKRHHPQSGKESVTPGISKIKSSLRQTRRLLAKDNLAANMRVETERRLRALETELAQAELANKERAMATRYHKVKFFERQKVTRKINQTKKQLSSTTDDSTEKKLVNALNDLRVDLNYILHYPKLKKYISLFPPEVRQDESGSGIAEEDAAKTAQAREEVRGWVRSCMEEGKFPKEPELHPSSDTKHHSKYNRWEGGVTSKKPTELKSKSRPALEEHDDAIEQDEFFGDDDESNAT
ncbi:hypothetical protein P691DRAFT_726683 [Macrolepiota fuliginosa MF-IS2]|uniref:rRNA-processing protein EFG1 n=1 Tax=Macrolepiota fuliginosa MF-IS2 TaxID=1400762 RepID=A0A9P6C6E7_9AGAR|nr:hypothetical protein P691DRAFT_726683 [Macrolepiota fuliginosa MF-IS2]